MVSQSFLIVYWIFLGCAPTKWVGYERDTGGTDVVLGGQAATWVVVTRGICRYSLFSEETLSEAQGVVEVRADGMTSATILGGENQSIFLSCDADAADPFGPVTLAIDPLACPLVFCNPGGESNWAADEDEWCGSDYWVEIMPEAWAAYRGVDPAECGPWNTF